MRRKNGCMNGGKEIRKEGFEGGRKGGLEGEKERMEVTEQKVKEEKFREREINRLGK